MSPYRIRIAIAESMGWSFQGITGFISYGYKDKKAVTVPDYPNDLNACHEFEKTLTPDQGAIFERHLESICQRALIISGTTHWLKFKCVSATAPQRCEAYLRTLNKWEEAQC